MTITRRDVLLERARYSQFARPTARVSAGVNEARGVVFHHTGGGFQGAVHWLSDHPQGTASAHVVIAKNGVRAILAADDQVTWHAGASAFRGRTGCNRFMLGVEFELTVEDVNANVALTDDQLQSALEWIAPRWARHAWSMDWMTDHRTVATPRGRKADLSVENWARVRQALADRFDKGEITQ